ncbi:MAG: phage major capsid protein [Bacteroidales bacterium]|nr:phage major capsid protein [Bacteroidales bacterium]
MKDFLKKLIADKEARAAELRTAIKSAETADAVRSLGDDLTAVENEKRAAEAQLAALESESRGAGLNPLASFGQGKSAEKREGEDPLATMEYRTAFMHYVQHGEKSDVLRAKMNEKRDDPHYSGTIASDMGVLLPTTVIQSIMEGVEKVYGQLYSRVRKTDIKGGVKYPIGSFSATFTRIGETGAPTDRQNAGAVTGYVEFSYNLGEIRLSQTLLASVLSVPVFEQKLVETIVKAYVKAMDVEIMTGVAANNQCEGILTEAAKAQSRIPASNIIEFTAEDMEDWTAWQKKLFAVIPLSMRSLRPEFVMTANTYESNIKTLKDNNNRPVYNETFNPVDGSEIAKFKGRDVCFVEEDILKNFDDATNGQYFGMYWVPEEAYAINTNLEFYVKRYFDDEKNEWVDKALVINDGKVLDPKYIYLLKKKVTA